MVLKELHITFSSFDDFGRPIRISFPSSSNKDQSSSNKIVKAIPKAETQQAVTSGVHKFRVKLLAQSGYQNTMDVLSQVLKQPIFWFYFRCILFLCY